MANIQLKIVDEGLKADQHSFVDRLRQALIEHDVYITEPAELTLKVKFCVDDGHEKVLLKVRESASKTTLAEDVILYFPDRWMDKAVSESVNLTTSVLETSH